MSTNNTQPVLLHVLAITWSHNNIIQSCLPANNATMYTRILSDHMQTLLSQITACRWCKAYLMTPCQSVNRKIYGRNHANVRTFNKIRYEYMQLQQQQQQYNKQWKRITRHFIRHGTAANTEDKVTSSLLASSTCLSVARELIQIIATSPPPPPYQQWPLQDSYKDI